MSGFSKTLRKVFEAMPSVFSKIMSLPRLPELCLRRKDYAFRALEIQNKQKWGGL